MQRPVHRRARVGLDGRGANVVALELRTGEPALGGGGAREDQDRLALESHQKAEQAYNEGFYDPLVMSWGGVMRDNNVRGDTSLEKLASLRTVFAKGSAATLTAGNSTPLTDGAAAVLLASEDWARAHDLPVQAYLTAGRAAAIDHVNDEGLLMAPTVAVAEGPREDRRDDRQEDRRDDRGEDRRDDREEDRRDDREEDRRDDREGDRRGDRGR